MKNYDKYIFVHDNNYELKNLINNQNNDIKFFHPNIKNNISNNILDYCKIIENSEEIHVIFSAFLNLCMYLDLSKVKKKYIYTNIINIKDLHKNMNDWIIIIL